MLFYILSSEVEDYSDNISVFHQESFIKGIHSDNGGKGSWNKISRPLCECISKCIWVSAYIQSQEMAEKGNKKHILKWQLILLFGAVEITLGLAAESIWLDLCAKFGHFLYMGSRISSDKKIKKDKQFFKTIYCSIYCSPVRLRCPAPNKQKGRVSPVSSRQRRTYPVAPGTGSQPSRTELRVTSATRKVVVAPVVSTPAAHKPSSDVNVLTYDKLHSKVTRFQNRSESHVWVWDL